MDNSKAVTHISLCSGYGGIDLGLKRAIQGLRTIAYSEIEAYACANLVAKIEKGFLDPAPIWTDLKTFPYQDFCGKVDILSGGYPCQPFSAAGSRKGTEDQRHLWPFIAKGIRVSRPAMCFFENVIGHISLGLSTVVSDLEEMGYKVSWGIFSAAEVGASHQRKRVFIFANSLCKRRQFSFKWSKPAEQMFGSESKAWRTDNGWFCTQCREDIFTSCQCSHNESQCFNCGEWTYPFAWDSKDGCSTCGQEWPKWNNIKTWPIESTVCGSNDGLTNRVDRLRLLGNGVVPATAYKAFVTLYNSLL